MCVGYVISVYEHFRNFVDIGANRVEFGVNFVSIWEYLPFERRQINSQELRQSVYFRLE